MLSTPGGNIVEMPEQFLLHSTQPLRYALAVPAEPSSNINRLASDLIHLDAQPPIISRKPLHRSVCLRAI